MQDRRTSRIAAVSALLIGAFAATAALAQAPGGQPGSQQVAQAQKDEYLPPWQRGQGGQGGGDEPSEPQKITPQRGGGDAGGSNSYGGGSGGSSSYGGGGGGRYNEPQSAPPSAAVYERRYDDQAESRRDYVPPRDVGPNYAPPAPYEQDTYSSNEIIAEGERFFGGVSKGLAKVIEHAFSKQGRPNGYILGEEAGGAFVAGLRYGEGMLYTKNAGQHRTYWQGPSFGYDFGAEGSKTLILVYNLHQVDQLYNRFAGVDGSAYLVGGVGVTFQTYDDVVLAPIRSGVGLRLGANVGYLKYTRTPTWNPF